MTRSERVLPSLSIDSKQLFTCALVATCCIAGCAAKALQPSVSGDAPEETLPAGSRIVADRQRIQLYAFEMTPEEWAALKKQRSAAIRGEAGSGAVEGAAGGVSAALPFCEIPPLCPFAIGIGAVVGGTVGAGGAALVGAAQAPWFIPPRHGSRLAATFNALATGDSLRGRALRSAGPAALQTATADEFPRLVVRMHSARLNSHPGASFAIALTAQAQVFPSAGEEWRLTQHTYQSRPRSLAEWTANQDELVRRELDEGLNALAKDIVSRYGLR